MYLPKIVRASDASLRSACKFERRLMQCLLVPPAGCSLSCQDTSRRSAGERSATDSRAVQVREP